MFAIAQKSHPYRTYVLSDPSALATVEVVPERGGIVTQWQIGDRAILYLEGDRFLNPDLSIRGGIPILFPICGNLPDNRYTLDGTSYTLPQHGFARNLPWQVTNQSTDQSASLSLSLSSTDQTQSVYPFDFHITFTYQLRGNTLTIHQRYTNLSSRPMPFSTGLHPYFTITDKTKLRLDLPAQTYQPKDDPNTYPFSGSFDYSQPEIDVAFTQVQGQRAIAEDQQLRIRLDYDAAYSTLVFWTVKDKDFYCLEPWSAPRNAINTGDRLTHLPPGESVDIALSITADLLT